MDNFYIYILFSKQLDKFYIGATRLNPNIRKERHLDEYYGKLKFTVKATDWNLYLEIKCTSFTQALKIENYIKRMKSKTYARNLLQYSEMVEKLLNQY